MKNVANATAAREGRDTLYQHILDNQAEFETLEGQTILRIPGAPIAALPQTGKKNARNWIAFDLATRETLANLTKAEVRGWLYRSEFRTNDKELNR